VPCVCWRLLAYFQRFCVFAHDEHAFRFVFFRYHCFLHFLHIVFIPDADIARSVESAMAHAEDTRQLRDSLQQIQARVKDTLASYETVYTSALLPESMRADGASRSTKATLQQTRQELLDTFNYRLVQQRAQSSTLKCQFNLMVLF
jgi:hypothetical protein